VSDREAMKEALRILTKREYGDLRWQVTDACDILRARLAAPEPVTDEGKNKGLTRAIKLAQNIRGTKQ
jgi:hypothetical protein